jgi:hypothetical protein
MSESDLIRFVAAARHPPYGHRSGVFVVAYRLDEGHGLAAAEHAELRELLGWFEQNLAKPSRFTPSTYPRAAETAISWIRATADGHVRRLRRLVALVEGAGTAIEELRTQRPGYIVYQDLHQVVALPFADTPR